MTIPIDTLRSINNKGAKAPELPALEAWLRSILATLPDGSKMTQRDLMSHAGYEIESDVQKLLSNALYHLRRSSAVEECYSTDATRRIFGNNLILWHKPGDFFSEEIF